jgi:hypothetical protein
VENEWKFLCWSAPVNGVVLTLCDYNIHINILIHALTFINRKHTVEADSRDLLDVGHAKIDHAFLRVYTESHGDKVSSSLSGHNYERV